MLTLRRFTKDDWSDWTGAEPFKFKTVGQHNDPWIGELSVLTEQIKSADGRWSPIFLEGVVVVVDDGGVYLRFPVDSGLIWFVTGGSALNMVMCLRDGITLNELCGLRPDILEREGVEEIKEVARAKHAKTT